jgi:hypothetical protein
MKVVRDALAEACRITTEEQGDVNGRTSMIPEGKGLMEYLEGKLLTVVSGQIIPEWDCLHTNRMLTSSKTDILICLFY